MEITPKDIAAWHRKQAKKHEDLAKKHREMAQSVAALSGAVGDVDSPTVKSTVTLEQLEKALKIKRGRPAHLAKRLNTTPDEIERLLADPNCQFIIGNRGFIFPRK